MARRKRNPGGELDGWAWARGNAIPRSEVAGRTVAGEVYQIGRKYYKACRDGWMRPVKAV